MKLSAFEKVIRKVVREEIDYALKREISLLKEELTSNTQVITERKTEPNPEDFRQKLREQFTPPSFNSGDSTLDSLLNETAIHSTPLESQHQHNSNDPVNQFINKDYSQLMKAMDKNKNFRP
tara:strand:- start:210 stop:575 length:366 start_codon:yes stop_codon:yes gene_type:complete